MLGFRGLVFMYNGEQPTFHLNWTMVDIAEADLWALPDRPILVLLAVASPWSG